MASMMVTKEMISDCVMEFHTMVKSLVVGNSLHNSVKTGGKDSETITIYDKIISRFYYSFILASGLVENL